ncbi:MAG: hypothetical protein AAFO95_08670 [Cyanobacteria bacterium J06600_6]
MAHVYLRVLTPKSEDLLTDDEKISNLRTKTQFIDRTWFTLEIANDSKGGLHFGIDNSSIDLETVVQQLSNAGYIFVI